MSKPVITIEDGMMKADLSLCESFSDNDMVEKYNNMQALIDMVYPAKELDEKLDDIIE